MELLNNIMNLFDDKKSFIELMYTIFFLGAAIFISFFSNKKKSKQNSDNNEEYQNSDYLGNLPNSSNKKNMPYKISRKKSNNPIFTGAGNDINYFRTFKIFLVLALISVLLTAFFTGTLDDIIFQILYLLDM